MKIIDLDQEPTYEHTDVYPFILKLSGEPVPGWKAVFDILWRDRTDRNLRDKVYVKNDCIYCHCGPYELDEHLVAINHIISLTDKEYKRHTAQQQAKETLWSTLNGAI